MAYRFKCPGCGSLDESDVQLCIPAWFAVKVEPTTGFFQLGKHVDTDCEADGHIYCTVCGHEGDEFELKSEFVEEIDDEETTQQQTVEG